MILQSVLFSDDICKKEELFFRSNGIATVNGDFLSVSPGGVVTFDTYMNIFDVKKWQDCTSVGKRLSWKPYAEERDPAAFSHG